MHPRVVQGLRDTREFRALSASRRDVMDLLWRRADDDGVVRKQVAERRIAEVLDMPQETVRKVLRHLDRGGYIRRVPGQGRERSHYAVRRSFALPILDPLAPPPELAGVQPPADRANTDPGTAPAADRSPEPGAGSVAHGADQAAEHSQPAAEPGEQAGRAGTPPPPARPPAPRGELAAAEASATDTTGWCADAILAGQRHENRRCCHTTARQVESARRKKAAAAALAAEQNRVRSLGMTDPARPAPVDIVAQARAAREAGKAEADERARTIRERKSLVRPMPHGPAGS